MKNYNELLRLEQGPTTDDAPVGLLATLAVSCEGDAVGLLARTKEVLAIILGQKDMAALDLDHWRKLLPQWLIGQFVPEITQRSRGRVLYCHIDRAVGPCQVRSNQRGITPPAGLR